MSEAGYVAIAKWRGPHVAAAIDNGVGTSATTQVLADADYAYIAKHDSPELANALNAALATSTDSGFDEVDFGQIMKIGGRGFAEVLSNEVGAFITAA